MSTDYYMACEKCKESIHVAQDGMSGFSFYSREPECMKALNHFLAVHTVCGGKVEWINEHREIDGDFKQIEWKQVLRGAGGELYTLDNEGWPVPLSAAPEAAEMAETLKRLRSQIPGCDCDNPAQCWESCGTLGHSEEHMKVIKDSNKP